MPEGCVQFTTPRTRQAHQYPLYHSSYNPPSFNTVLSLSPLGRQNYREPTVKLSQYLNPQTEQARMSLLAHEKETALRSEESYKTVICRNWLETATCAFGKNCRFAHGESELKPSRIPLLFNGFCKYKTRLCENYTKKGLCQYGPRCLFIHPDEQSVIISAPSTDGCNPSIPFQRSSYMVNFMTDSPPEIQNFALSMPNSMAMSRKNRNLLPQVQQELKMEKHESRKKQLHDQVREQDRMLASAEKKERHFQQPSLFSSSNFITNQRSSKHSPQYPQKFYEAFDETHLATLASTLSQVLDTSDIT